MNAAIKHYRISELEAQNPEFIKEMRIMYGKRGWLMPTHVHVDLSEIAKKLNKRPEAIRAADAFFERTGTVAEKPKQILI